MASVQQHKPLSLDDLAIKTKPTFSQEKEETNMTMTFANAVARDASPAINRGYTRTENGMRTLQSTMSANVDLFGSIVRGKNLVQAFELAFQENPDVAMRVAQYARDIRGGQGERKIFRDLLLHLERTRPDILTTSNVLMNIVQIGRFDDLLIFSNPEVKSRAFTIIAGELGKGNGLCAKWMPRKGLIAAELRNWLNLSPKQYRKLLVKLTNVVETKMCAREFDSINFSHVPSVAMSRYMTAFHKRAPEAFSAYKEALKKGDPKIAKVNASAVYPYEVVAMVGTGYYTRNNDSVVADEMWKALPDYMNGKAVLPMVDVSGSMGFPLAGSKATALDVAVSLGLYCSERTKNPAFKDLFLTFSGTPEFVKVSGSLANRVSTMSRANWDMNTDLHKAFEKVLSVAVQNNVPDSEMPEVLLILSDMQFDHCARYDDTAIQMIRRKYESAGYTMPAVVFWNLNSRSNDKPVRYNERGVALVSGFSPAIMKSVLGADFSKFSPENVMLEAVMIDRYNW